MRFGGQLILGVTATDMREADKLVHLWNAPQVEETPTGVVCARPVNARPYVPR